MVTDLQDIKDPEAVCKRIAKYTECFDLLDRLGADNCIDPEDFDQEDLNDDMFKNLQISDIEEIFKEDEEQAPQTPGQEFQDYSSRDFKEQDEDTIAAEFVEVTTVDIENGPLDLEPLHNDQDSDLRSEEGEEDLQFMDFEEQMKIYEKMQEE